MDATDFLTMAKRNRWSPGEYYVKHPNGVFQVFTLAAHAASASCRRVIPADDDFKAVAAAAKDSPNLIEDHSVDTERPDVEVQTSGIG